MRTRIMLALLAGWASAGFAMAQTIPPDRVIAQPVEVRSGPGMNFYPTSTLKAGDTVKVRRALTDQPGWLEIEPPADSYSWINTKLLKQDTKDLHLWTVVGPDSASTIAGSRVDGAGRPNVISPMRLSPGTIVVAVRDKVAIEGETWLPIKPHVGEARYIPTTAVQDTTTVAKMNMPTSWTLPPQTTYADPLLLAAQQKEQAGDRAGALQLYQQIVNHPANPNSMSLAQQGVARLQQTGYGVVQGTTTSLSPANPLPNAAPALQTLKAPEWSPYGRLRDVKQTTPDGQALYSLEDSNDRIISYVSTPPGKSLQSLTGRWITVYGPTMYAPGSRLPYIVVSHTYVP